LIDRDENNEETSILDTVWMPLLEYYNRFFCSLLSPSSCVFLLGSITGFQCSLWFYKDEDYYEKHDAMWSEEK
jgi:hypothetical protein